MNKAELFKRIQELAFVKTELELFLDTHPECMAALDYYHRIVDEYGIAIEEYETKYGPITASAVMGDRWTWVESPWPWHIEANGGVGGNNGNGANGGCQRGCNGERTRK